MDGWLKALIATACCVVIAGGGYLGWQEWSERSRIRELAKKREAVRNELFEFAGAARHEEDKVRSYCRNLPKTSRMAMMDRELAEGLQRNCRALGYY